MIFDRASKSLSLYHQQAGRSRWRGIDDELPHLFQLFALRGEIESLEAYRWSLETSGQDYFLKTTDGSFYKPTMLGFASQLREIAQSPFGLVEDGHDPSDSHKLLYEMDGSYLHSFRFTSKIEASYPLLLATVSNEGNRAISKDTRLDGRKGIQLVNPVDGKSHFVVQEIPHGLQVISPEGIRRMLLDKSRKLMKPDSQRFSTVTAMASNDDRLIILMENTDRHYSLALVDTKMIFDDRAQSLAFLSSEVTVDPDRNFPAKNLFHVEAKGDFIHVHGWRKSSQNQKTFIEWVYQIEGANRQGLKLVDIKTTTIILNDSEQGLD
jgi:hypothetical protein